VKEAMGKEKPLVVIGPPGCGKQWLCEHAASDLGLSPIVVDLGFSKEAEIELMLKRSYKTRTSLLDKKRPYLLLYPESFLLQTWQNSFAIRLLES
jgi:hypothetical protein